MSLQAGLSPCHWKAGHCCVLSHISDRTTGIPTVFWSLPNRTADDAQVLFQATIPELSCNSAIVHSPRIGLRIKAARPIKWLKRKRGWYCGQKGIVKGQYPLYHIPLSYP